LREQPLISLRVGQVAGDIAEAHREFLEQLYIELIGQRRAQRLFHVCAPGVVVPWPPRCGDEIGDLGQQPLGFQMVERGQQLGGSEMTGGAEDYEAARGESIRRGSQHLLRLVSPASA
jgi:hypothetical protein